MKRTSWISFVCAMFLSMIVMTPISAFAGERPSGKPFEAIWDELDDQQRQIDGFQEQIDDLQAQINSLQTGLDDEIAARIAGDNNLQNQMEDLQEQVNEIQEQIDDLQAQIDAEKAARIAADIALQNNIDAETAARIAGDIMMQNNIDAEEAARVAEDIALQNNIDSETAARIAGDILLQDQIDNHEHTGEDITSGTIDNARLNTGHGNGLNADTVDGLHASEFGSKWSGSGSDIYYNNGSVGIGTSTPSGLLHGNGSAGGFMFWESDSVDDTPQTIIPDGFGDVEKALSYRCIIAQKNGTGIRSVTGSSSPGSLTYLYGYYADMVVLDCASDGSVSVYRTGGSDIYEVVLSLIWL